MMFLLKNSRSQVYLCKNMFLLFLVLSNLVLAQALQTLPLFVIDTDSILSHLPIVSDPLKTLNKPEFVTLLQNIKAVSKTTIVFVEESFCIEDLTTKDKVGTPFYHLRQSLTEKKVKYIPRVFQPYKTLVEVMEPNDNVFHLNSKNTQLDIFTQLEHFNKNQSYYYVFFQDNTEATRIEKLRQHDLIMKEVFFVARKFSNGPVVAIYTGMSNPVTITHLTPKPVSVAAEDTGLFKSFNVWIKMSGLERKLNNGQRWKVMLRNEPKPKTITVNDLKSKRVQTNITVSDMELSFQFTYDDKEWVLESIALIEENEEVGRTKVDVSADWGMSYECATEPIKLVNLRDMSSFVISQYQIQVDKPNTRSQKDSQGPLRRAEDPSPDGSGPGTGDAGPGSGDSGPGTGDAGPGTGDAGPGTGDAGPGTGDAGPGKGDSGPGKGDSGPGKGSPGTAKILVKKCETRFTEPILTGLFITSIILFIFFYALTAMMNCNSNKRYDDPQGKVLDFTEHS